VVRSVFGEELGRFVQGQFEENPLMDFTSLPLTWQAVIPVSYLDENNHMNVMWYTHLFSGATGGLFDRVGLTMAYFEANQAGTFALEQHLRFMSEVRAGQAISIRTRVLGRSLKRFHFMHFMIKDEGAILAATEEAVGSHVDLRVRRTSPLPHHVSEKFDRLLAEHGRLAWPAPVCGVMKA
jgi:acyl-CoA thioester hydrolase